MRSKEERNFRWAYRLLLAFAQRLLADANDACGGEWPSGQEWHELSNTSRSIFLHRARVEAGVSGDRFLEGIRSGEYDVADLYQGALGVQVPWYEPIEAKGEDGQEK